MFSNEPMHAMSLHDRGASWQETVRGFLIPAMQGEQQILLVVDGIDDHPVIEWARHRMRFDQQRLTVVDARVFWDRLLEDDRLPTATRDAFEALLPGAPPAGLTVYNELPGMLLAEDREAEAINADRLFAGLHDDHQATVMCAIPGGRQTHTPTLSLLCDGHSHLDVVLSAEAEAMPLSPLIA